MSVIVHKRNNYDDCTSWDGNANGIDFTIEGDDKWGYRVTIEYETIYEDDNLDDCINWCDKTLCYDWCKERWGF